MARYDDLDTTSIGFAAVISSVVLLILILLGRAIAYGWANSAEDRKSQTARYVISETEIARQKALLAEFAQVRLEEVESAEGEAASEPEEESSVRLVIPVGNALELVSEELSSEPST
jgi:hypothetical protein